MKIRIAVWSFVALFAAFVFTARHEVEIPCDQCGKVIVKRCLLARAVSGFDTGFLHAGCVEQWCIEHPLRFDEDGNLLHVDEYE